MKKGYYGVYGKNGDGIFTNWTKVQEAKVEIVGFKCKKFGNEIDSLDYIVAGLIENYEVISDDNLNDEKLLEKIGEFIPLKDLMLDKRKRVHPPQKNYWGVEV